jgi:hypothetical protein
MMLEFLKEREAELITQKRLIQCSNDFELLHFADTFIHIVKCVKTLTKDEFFTT